MRKTLRFRYGLFLVLVASVAMGKGRDPHVRSVYLRGGTKDRAEEVYVLGQVTTVLRFEQLCDPAGTTMLGWEGRFEPVECVGKTVLLVPLRNLQPEDRFMLVVTLADGTELPFTVVGAGQEEWKWPDQQVNVFLEPEEPDALRQQLEEARARELALMTDQRRRLREDTADHALAKLLTSGGIKQTRFKLRKRRLFQDKGVTTLTQIYSGKGKAAVLFNVTNHAPSKKPWRVMQARLVAIRLGADPEIPYAFGDARPFALRQDRDEIAFDEAGNVAVVVDKSAFLTENGPAQLLLELYNQDGWR